MLNYLFAVFFFFADWPICFSIKIKVLLCCGYDICCQKTGTSHLPFYTQSMQGNDFVDITLSGLFLMFSFFPHDTILLHLLPGVFGDEGFFNENQVVCWKFWSKWRKLRLHRIRSNQKNNKGKWNCGHVGNIRNCECGKIIGCPALKSLLCFISYSKKNLKSWLPEFGTPALLEWSSTDTKQ